MTVPMYVHAALIVVIGLYPAAGLALTRAASALFTEAGVAANDASLVALLAPVQIAVRVLVALALIACALGLILGRGAARQVTWGCGYTAPNARMQVTASSFSAQFARVFESLLPQLRRERLSREVFPLTAGHIGTTSTPWSNGCSRFWVRANR